MFPFALLALLCLLVALPAVAQFSFVTHDDAEFISAGDFNGDGRPDVLVLDRATGNARVGYQDASGNLTWAQPLPTGVPRAHGVALGNFLGSNRTAIAISSFERTGVAVIDLAFSNTVAGAYPKGVPSGLLSPYRAAAAPSAGPDWVCAGADRDPGVTIVELFDYLGESLLHRQSSRSIPGMLSHGNALPLVPGGESLIAAMQRGSNDTFLALSMTNSFSTVLARSNLAAGAQYAFGRFNGEALPRFLFYVPGQSNVLVQRVQDIAGTYALSEATITTLTSAVQRIYVVDEQTNSLVLVRFGDGLMGARLPAGNDSLMATYRFGAGTNGSPIAALSLGNGRLALLNGHSNAVGAVTSETWQFNGSAYTRTSSSPLTSPATYASRANIWLFATEPFVTSPAVFVSSLNAGAWVSSVNGLPGALNVTTEQDRGTSAGLGNPSQQTLAVPPATAIHALANQYHPAISLFSYGAARPPQPSLVVISPPPGHYTAPISISFTTSNSSDSVFFRLGGSGSFDNYTAPIALGTNAQISYYGVAAGSPERSLLQTASYTFDTTPFAPLVTTNGTGTNNIPQPPVTPGATSSIPTYAYGTLFYSRRTGTNGAIWSITLDGFGDRFITQGTRPRLSPEGRYLAFLRGGRPFDTIPQDNGSIWLRDLLTGEERLLVARTNLITGFDWEYGTTNLVFDHGCGLFRTDLAGNVTPLPFATTCPEDAPAVSPADGRLAFHAVAPLMTNYGIYVTDPGVTTKQYLNLPLAKPRRPAWSPDGVQLALADYSFTYIPESGMNLYVVNPDGSGLHQITGFTQVEGFREGALWTPQADALVGAATIAGVNGIWLVPLTPDRTQCASPPVRLPTLSGDDIDFVGSVFVPPGPPRLKIWREGSDAVVNWRRTAWPYVLQLAGEPTSQANWTDLPGPYQIVNGEYQFRVPDAALLPTSFFRLRLP